MTAPEYVKQVGPCSSITLQFGEISDAELWISIDTSWPGEYGCRDAGDGVVQVFTFDVPPEHKARNALSVAVSFSNAIRRLQRGAASTPFLTDEDSETIKRVGARTERLWLDGEHVGFCVVQALGLTAASANFTDRTVTVWGRFDPVEIRLQSVANLDRYLR